MHLLARQLNALDRAELTPTNLIELDPDLATSIALRWGEAALSDELLALLMSDAAQTSGEMGHRFTPTVVRELMRLSTAYADLLPQIAATKDIWGNEREVSELPKGYSDGYIRERNNSYSSKSNTLGGYVDAAPTIMPVRDDEKEWTPLLQACFAGRLDRVEKLIEQGAHIHWADKDGYQALHLAALQGYVSIVALLLEHGADANAISRRFATALHLAAARGHLEVVDALLDAGVSINHAKHDGWTALHKAVASGHDEVVVRLLRAGANPMLETKAGQTAIALVPSHKMRMAELLEHAIPKRKLQVLAGREIVSQAWIDWN
ncbi:ankyrin repeat domain-containing protein [Chitinibacter bivalviorum]|uniref:Ankyrin repeat domain-containing protein n=1 Tax=Chitinibacter bivalviorum TaxID=2739434 RepID=A0A7H9BEH9_9NEIS|nr:ankyrin repeat domain-containing protein [Chitinibacter bivalviorum]QLG87133.1 ankyrin repeat domain-containing protein [Chitinibacter bivalviorum]